MRAKSKWIVVVFLLCLPFSGGLGGRSALAEDGENQFLAMLLALQEDPRPGRTFRIPESDLNRFIAAEVGQHRVSAVERVAVALLEGHFSAELVIDADQLEFEDSMSGSLLQSMLRGKQTLKLEGGFAGSDGVGRYETRRAWLNGVTLPASLVDMILKTVGKRQDPPFDPTRPFPLPGGIRSITLRAGEVELTT